MWEILCEIVPGLFILACALLFWQQHIDLRSVRRDWEQVMNDLSEAASWEEAAKMIKAYQAGERND